MNERTKCKLSKHEELLSVREATHLVLFVHGLGGKHWRSWGRLPAYLADDPRFAHVDIYLFGFSSGFFNYFASPLESLGQRLRTILVQETDKYSSVCVVAHSMGGLVVKHAVADALLAGEAYRLRHLKHAVFCSTPHLGEVKASALALLGTHVAELRALRPQILHSHRIWQSRVNSPSATANDIVHERYAACVRVTNVWGDSDWVVSRENACALSSDEQVITVSGSHFSMIKPASNDDARYRTLSRLFVTGAGHHGAAMPSERMINRSQHLADPALRIIDTKSMPTTFEKICDRL
jgi:pimeloyl-ACP methyl ester carboxylesterase